MARVALLCGSPPPAFFAQDVADRQRHFLALAAAAAALRHATDELGVLLVPNSLAVSHRSAAARVHIDAQAARSLELVAPLEGGLASSTLLGMFKPRTRAGARLLRVTLLQPPRDVATIQARLDCLEEVLGSEALFGALSQLLPQLRCLDWLGQFAVQKKRNGPDAAHCAAAISSLLELRATLQLLVPLRTALAAGQCELLASMHAAASCAALDALCARIEEILDDAPLPAPGKQAFSKATNAIFAVKPGVSGLLDVSRRAFAETTDAVYDHVQELNETSGVAVRASFAARKGFFLTCGASEFEALPPAAQQLFNQVLWVYRLQCGHRLTRPHAGEEDKPHCPAVHRFPDRA